MTNPKKTYRPYEPDQPLLFRQSPRDWLPDNHLVYFLDDVVEGLNITAVTAVYEREGRGYPPYHPRLMVKVLLYSYCLGLRSSRKIQRALHEDVAFRVLGADNFPDFRTIAKFRKKHRKALAGLFRQVLDLCKEAGLVQLRHVSVDGSKIKANASKHKAMSYGRMRKEEKRLEAEIEGFLKESDKVDQDEDDLYGKNKTGDELPEELRRREGRKEVIRRARERLEERAKERDKEAIEKREQGEKTNHKRELGVPKDKEQENFTDPESRIMKDGATKAFVQGYNAQVVVDEKAQIIVAADVTQQANDKQQIEPMVEQVKVNTGGTKPKKLSADSGYYSEDNVTYLANEGIDAYVTTGRRKHGEEPPPAPRGRIPKDATVKERMSRKLRTKKGQDTYRLRKQIVEPVFGQIKAARGIRQFLLRGLDAVRDEWTLICTSHNILKLYRASL